MHQTSNVTSSAQASALQALALVRIQRGKKTSAAKSEALQVLQRAQDKGVFDDLRPDLVPLIMAVRLFNHILISQFCRLARPASTMHIATWWSMCFAW